MDPAGSRVPGTSSPGEGFILVPTGPVLYTMDSRSTTGVLGTCAPHQPPRIRPVGSTPAKYLDNQSIGAADKRSTRPCTAGHDHETKITQ